MNATIYPQNLVDPIEARPFAFPHDGSIEASRIALVIIDLQRDFLAEDGYFARMGYDPTPLRKILPNVSSLIAAAREAGCHIVHTRQGYRADLADMTEYEHWRRRRSGLEGTEALLRGTCGFEIVPELDVQKTDIIIDKTANGAFTHTDLEHVLRARGITHLLITGCTTEVCVHTTLREASDRNFICCLVEDACASGDTYAHEAAVYMTTVENGVFGVVADTEAVVKAMTNSGHQT